MESVIEFLNINIYIFTNINIIYKFTNRFINIEHTIWDTASAAN